MQVLVVEDEVRLGAAIKQILQKEKHMADVVGDGNDAWEYIRSGIYDAIILDVMLPGMDGVTLARKAREEKIETPILMLTARTEVADKVAVLDSGADDYMTKPFAPPELLARLRAITRRQGEVITNKLSFGDLSLDLTTNALSCGTRSTHLNFKESELFKLLALNQGAAVTKENIITKVWGYDSDAGDNNVEAYISFLRKKLAYLGSSVKITSLRKVGYLLEES